jgi:hypothetical protein
VANFSFGIVDAVFVLLTALWACSAAKKNDCGAWQCTRMVAASSLPALAIIVGIAGWTLLHWPKGQFVYGAASLSEMFGSVLNSSVYEVNPVIVNPLLYSAIVHLPRAILTTLGLVFIWRIVLFFRQKRDTAAEPDWHWTFAFALAAALALTVAAHWLMHVLWQILLPKERTAIYIVPLVMLLAGSAAAAPVRSLASVLCRKSTIVLLCTLSIYFLLCLRLSYFKEWKFEADTQNAYRVISYYNHAYGIRDIVTPWMYSSSLEFYRRLSGHESFPAIAWSQPYPPNHCLYVLDSRWDHDFAERERLKIVYRGEFSDMVVAINPELEKSGVSACSNDEPQAGR